MNELDLKPNEKIHFIGIGGVSMSGLAHILLDRKIPVSGSDMKASALTDELSSLGAEIKIGQSKDNITDDIRLVVYTAAISPENPELAAAKERSYELYAADQDLRDARRSFMGMERYNNYLSDSYTLYVQAEYQWSAAKLQYESAVASYEVRFRVLYFQVKNYCQIWEAARTALAAEERNWEVALYSL